MSDTGNDFDRTDDILACDVSDEALEIAAGDERAGHYTLYFCTALDLSLSSRLERFRTIGRATDEAAIPAAK